MQGCPGARLAAGAACARGHPQLMRMLLERSSNDDGGNSSSSDANSKSSDTSGNSSNSVHSGSMSSKSHEEASHAGGQRGVRISLSKSRSRSSGSGSGGSCSGNSMTTSSSEDGGPAADAGAVAAAAAAARLLLLQLMVSQRSSPLQLWPVARRRSLANSSAAGSRRWLMSGSGRTRPQLQQQGSSCKCRPRRQGSCRRRNLLLVLLLRRWLRRWSSQQRLEMLLKVHRCSSSRQQRRWRRRRHPRLWLLVCTAGGMSFWPVPYTAAPWPPHRTCTAPCARPGATWGAAPSAGARSTG